MQSHSEPLDIQAPSVSVVFLCVLWCARYRLARELHAYDKTTTKSQHYNYNINRLTASVLHASPCLQLSIPTARRKEKAHGHARPSRL